MFMKLSVIIPTYNDDTILQNIPTIIKELNELHIEYEIHIIDDGSARPLAFSENIKYTYYEVNHGKGYAFRVGIKIATGDYILLMDSDLQIHPREVKSFFSIMDIYDSDCVIGNKRHPYSNVTYTFSRNVMSNTYAYMIRMLFGIRFNDTQVGFKLFKARILKDILPNLVINRFAFDVEILAALMAKGYRIADAPVHMSARTKSTAANIKTIMNMLYDTVRIWIRKKKGCYA